MSENNESLNENKKRKREEEDNEFKDSLNKEKNQTLDESYITMLDVLEEEEKLEEDAYAVLAGSDDKNCTYDNGYISRQAIYACKTCMGENVKPEDYFGICLACSYACHEKHDLFELYTKRNFRCDCGTDKMKGKKECSLNTKIGTNENNKYNHNFVGRYCICDKPYPSVDGKDEQMVQCVICEDWFHENCLNCKFPDDENYSELICNHCMSKNQYLWYYQTEKIKIITEEASKVDIESITEDKKVLDNQVKDETALIPENNSNTENDTKTENDLTLKTENNLTLNECKLKSLKENMNIENKKGVTFWEEDWRKNLCKCSDCLKIYNENSVEFLTDEKDTVHYYETKAKESVEKISQYERGLNEISKIDRVVGINAITEYNEMTTEFKEHFKKFAENKKIIEQKDIEEFFESLKYKKRMKYENSI